MTVGVDAREICNRPAGKGQYLLRVLASWKQQKAFPMVLYVEEGQRIPEALAKDSGDLIQVVEVAGGFFFHRRVAKRLRADGVSVFFAALSYLSAIFNPVPTVTVIHDLAVFRLKGFRHNRKAQIIEHLTLRPCVRRSAHLIAVSESTKRDVMEIGKAKESDVSVVYEAALLNDKGGDVAPLPLEKRGDFFLFVATLEPRKNVATVMKAYVELPETIRERYRLVLAGKIGWGGEDYPAMAEELSIKEKVTFTGYVSDDEVRRLFREAAVFIYPSFYEGFGLPVIEAMMSGTPPIVSNVSSLPEVVGKNGLLCAPTDYSGIAKTIVSLVSDSEYYAKISQDAYQTAKKFKWEDISKELALIVGAQAKP
jgi:alpha-1,3-rhamnosyl/mannosyltransferase